MTSFSLVVQSVCISLLLSLILYTLWLTRSERLNAHTAVRWVLAECLAMVAIVLWQWLPMFSVTSSMGDRELLVVLAVVFFVLGAFLMLDSLVRISTHTGQIKLLTQEVALLRERLDGCEKDANDEITDEESPSSQGGTRP